MSVQKKRGIGVIGENIAARYLRTKGYNILSMNFQNDIGYRRGELDIVARDPKTQEIVFVEVKSRKKNKYLTDPFRAITRSKYARLRKIISSYLNRHNISDTAYRLDAIAVEFDVSGRKIKINHLKHIYY